ncbi:unnamed protein product [Caenorhabditis auriculariae]|uniref:Uncharacterized protein n=1 Tax=Caenorhabditis auriculariae TaxID=2777116 RepID=A0A8S1H3W4_9PELO|nr:unnamed protein product [Caenorhabditis auriculariae]
MASNIFFSINKSQERSVGDGTETLLLDTINKILDMICTLASMGKEKEEMRHDFEKARTAVLIQSLL